MQGEDTREVLAEIGIGAAAVEDGEGYTKPFCLLERRIGTNGAKRGEWPPAHQFDIPLSVSAAEMD